MILKEFDLIDVMKIGTITSCLGIQETLAMVVEVRIGDWLVYNASLQIVRSKIIDRFLEKLD